MVYMVGDAELQSSIDRDLLELGRADSNEQVDIVVAIQQTANSVTEWFEIESRGAEKPRAKKRTVKQPTTGALSLQGRLNEFLKFVAGYI